MLPAIVLVETHVDLHKWSPFRPLRFADQMDAGFLRSAIRFLRITLDAGANDVFPSRRAAAIARDDVVEVQVFAIENDAAILAGVAVALENVVTGELHFLFRKAIKHQKQNDARHADLERDGRDGFRVRFLFGKVAPLREIVGLEGTVLVTKHDLSVTLEHEG